jgi:hypothetical protein
MFDEMSAVDNFQNFSETSLWLMEMVSIASGVFFLG